MTHEEANQACIALFQNLGKSHARRIMAQTVAMELEPDTMEGMINACIDDVRIHLQAKGVCPGDVDAAAQHVYFALVKEGGRIARGMTWEHGHA